MTVSPLMPAKAGIQFLAKYWVPAFAGTSGSNRYAFSFCSAAHSA